MFSTILFIIMVAFFSTILFFSTYSSTKRTGNTILGLSLPNDAFGSSNLVQLVKSTQKKYVITLIVFLVLATPFVFIGKYYSISIAYLTIWFVAFLLINNTNVKQAISSLYLLKIENGWTTATSTKFTLDTVVLGMRNQFPVKKILFFIPLSISFVPLISLLFSGRNYGDAIFYSAVSVTSCIVFFIAYVILCRTRTTSLSKNTDVNVALNKLRIHKWSKALFNAATVNSATIVGLFFVLRTDLPLYPVLLIVVLALIFTLSYVFFSYGLSVRNQSNAILEHDQKRVDIDDDLYWLSGNYSNPEDKKVVVDKRIGYGTTLNMASTVGKVVNAFLVLVVILVLIVSLLLIPVDFGKISTTFEPPSTINIHAPYMELTIDARSVKTIELVDDVNIGSKVKGVDSSVFYVGQYNVSSYGICTTALYRNVQKYIVICTEDGHIILTNADTIEGTNDLYKELLAH